MAWAFSQVYNHVAAALEIDPMEIALKHAGAEGETWEQLQEYRNEYFREPNRNSLQECVDIAKAAIDWDNKKHAPGAKILPNGRYHGMSMQHSHCWTNAIRPSWSAITIRRDGTCNIVGMTGDIGVNPHSTYCQMVADEIGLKYEDVELRNFYDTNYYLGHPGGSTACVANSCSIVPCARKAKKMLLQLACQPTCNSTSKAPRDRIPPGPAAFPDMTPEDLECEDSVIFEKANPENKMTVKEVMNTYMGTSRSAVKQEPVQVDQFSGPVDWQKAHAFQVHCIEVEVDVETGQVFVTNVVCVNDMGKILNPDTCKGQQYGGAYMGVGRSNTEAIYYDPATGRKLNDNNIGYCIALMNDIKKPPNENDCHLIETSQGYGAYGVVGIGEDIGAIMTSCTPPAIYNAVGIWLEDLPTTPDKVLKALGKI
jgi:CO/xanthine dehydrogenase Mo-binding subunit